ncbi:MAG: hypothetical protein OXQ94_04245 [Gemmatimonadota bacterium]|nr:hypothetical protein [Gemmatimonadota bacterium]MDE2870884.1 hypothetical protein [Gemmatimonadota bacterium]
MRIPVGRVAGAALAVAALFAMVFLSRIGWRSADPGTAELRLSWRIPAPSHRECRPPTEAELSGVLPHMRPTEICSDEAIPFHLGVQLDGDTLHSGPVERAGPRARTITIYMSFAISPGSHVLEVAFLPEAPPEAEPGVAGDPDSAPDSADPDRNLAMRLSATVFAAAGDVILVSPDERGRLVVAAR